MNEIISYLQLGANGFALVVAGLIYRAYIKNLNSSIKLKDEQISTVEKNLKFWKEKAEYLEKKSPENIEKILNERIKIREEEIERLSKDKESHAKELNISNQELLRLKSEVEKTKDVRRNIELLELDIDEDDFFSKDAVYEIEEMGYVAVDSGQLMITDPCYIDSEWQQEDFEDIRLYKDTQTSEIYQFGKDFNHYEEKIDGFDETVNELVESKRLEAIEVDYTGKIKFSYAGACHSTMSEMGYGALPFKMGNEGAGIVVATVLGDGMYPVYAEKYDGEIVRVYFNLI